MIGGFSRNDLFVDSEPARAFTLPYGTYCSLELHEHELHKIFRRGWMALPRNFFTALSKDERQALEISGNKIVFRFWGGEYVMERSYLPGGNPELLCFSNLCPHMGYPLEKQPINTRQEKGFRCVQHGLRANFDGVCNSHPAFQRVSQSGNCSLACLNMARCDLKQWLDLTFLCPEGKPLAPFEEFFGPMQESVSRLPLSEFTYAENSDEERTLDGNWKLHATNYMDYLHIPEIHKDPGGLEAAVYMDSYGIKLHRYCAVQWAHARNPEAGFDWQYIPEMFRDPRHPDRKVFALWWFIYPNMTFNFYPWGMSVSIYTPIYGDPSHIRFLWYHYVWDQEKYLLRDTLWLNARVDREDVDAMREQQQRFEQWGHKYKRGKFGPQREEGTHWLHRCISLEILADWD